MLIIRGHVIVCALAPFTVQGTDGGVSPLSSALVRNMHSVFGGCHYYRAAWKAISSWQHTQATRLSHAGKLGTGHRNHCHFHMPKHKGTADWKRHMLSFGLFPSHPTPHCPAHCQTYLWISAWRFVFTLSLLFFLSVWVIFPVLSTDAYWALAIWKALFWEPGK